MFFPGTCPECKHVGLEGVLAEPQDYLECTACGWRSDVWMKDKAEAEPVTVSLAS